MSKRPEAEADRAQPETATRRRRFTRDARDLDRDVLEAVREVLGLEPLLTKSKELEDESYANPTPQPLGWIIGGAIVAGAAAWWLYKSKNTSESSSESLSSKTEGVGVCWLP